MRAATRRTRYASEATRTPVPDSQNCRIRLSCQDAPVGLAVNALPPRQADLDRLHERAGYMVALPALSSRSPAPLLRDKGLYD